MQLVLFRPVKALNQHRCHLYDYQQSEFPGLKHQPCTIAIEVLCQEETSLQC